MNRWDSAISNSVQVGVSFSDIRNKCLQKSLTIFGSAFYGSAILMTTTDFFLENSLVLNWVWERVKVDRMIDKNLKVLVNLLN